MNRKVIKPVVLSGLFLAALIVFSIITNQDNKDMTTAMKGGNPSHRPVL